MNKTEILNIVNEPSKHIQIVKVDGKDSIVYSSKFVELLELIPTMLTKDDVAAMLIELKTEIEEIEMGNNIPFGFEPVNKFYEGISASSRVIQQKINELKENIDGKNNN